MVWQEVKIWCIHLSVCLNVIWSYCIIFIVSE